MTAQQAGLSGADIPRVLIVADHASARFGGEAALPFHYFRVLRARGAPVWLISHARTRDELTELFGDDPRIRYVEDAPLHRRMFAIGRRLPAGVAYLTTGFVTRFASQLEQRRLVRQLVTEERIEVIHQPMPVSPREPSLLYGFGVPVVIGPMNGGMEWPPAFRPASGRSGRAVLRAARATASLLNRIMPGKRQAALLLVANQRTREALPDGIEAPVVEMVENGVDLRVWDAESPPARAQPAVEAGATTFAFMGRLVDWKAVDLLIRAFAKASARQPMRLLIIGDGVERPALVQLARELGLAMSTAQQAGTTIQATVEFAGWLPQTECARRLEAADCLVLPSLLECGGAVVLEAMAMGKPVIATAWGGPLDYLDDACGVLVPPTGADALIDGLADAMVRLAQAPDERMRLGRNGREKARRVYDWDVKVDRMIGYYRQAMQTT
jgi:glycosyltransferase involved in cell wall biosynthesis